MRTRTCDLKLPMPERCCYKEDLARCQKVCYTGQIEKTEGEANPAEVD